MASTMCFPVYLLLCLPILFTNSLETKLIDELFIRKICKSLELGDLCFRGTIHKICTYKRSDLLKPMCCKSGLVNIKDCPVQTLESIDSTSDTVLKKENSLRPNDKSDKEIHTLNYGGILNETNLRILMINCNNLDGLCLDKDDSHSASIKRMSNLMLERYMLDSKQARNQFSASVQVEKLQKTVFQAKMRTLETQGLRGIKPLDDGLWMGDLLLSLPQAQLIIDSVNHLQRGVQLPTPTSIMFNADSGGRPDRDVFNFITSSIKEWDPPIMYMLEEQFDRKETKLLESAIKEIERKTCLKFTKLVGVTESQPHIQFRKFNNSNKCMISNLGAQSPFNIIWLNMANCSDIKRHVERGLLYTLGMIPEHIRADREYWINIDWSKVNAQYWHYFDIRPFIFMKSFYGQVYSYHSVLHAQRNLGSINAENTTISAAYFSNLLNPLIGNQRNLSPQDGEFLKIMYCQKKDCVDEHILCGYWASRYFCYDQRYSSTMIKSCKKSCQLCN